ncbi:MAG: hypothetical protein OCD02_09565 [Spirochaetaceae bacterium]
MSIKNIGKKITKTIIFITVISCTTINKVETPPLSIDVRDDMPDAVVSFLDDNGWDMDQYKSISNDKDINYNNHSRYYLIDINRDKLWNEYTTQDARTSWTGEIIDYGLLYSQEHDSVFTLNEKVDLPYAVGQIFFLDLEFVNIFNICVAFKITKIEREEKIIEFRYLEKNFVNGYQSIKFISLLDENGNDVCLIEHKSYFKSNNFIQDKLFYPPFHIKAIDDLHNQVFERMNVKNSIISETKAKIMIN